MEIFKMTPQNFRFNFKGLVLSWNSCSLQFWTNVTQTGSLCICWGLEEPDISGFDKRTMLVRINSPLVWVCTWCLLAVRHTENITRLGGLGLVPSVYFRLWLCPWFQTFLLKRTPEPTKYHRLVKCVDNFHMWGWNYSQHDQHHEKFMLLQ